MGVFDYKCLINSETCLTRNSLGQDCSYGEVYLVDKNLTKKLLSYYTGYGSALYKGDIEIYDSGLKEDDEEYDEDVKESYFSCPNCAKNIIYEVSTLEEFFKEINEDPEIINNKKIVFKEKELNDLILCRNKINKKIRFIRKEIEKLKNN